MAKPGPGPRGNHCLPACLGRIFTYHLPLGWARHPPLPCPKPRSPHRPPTPSHAPISGFLFTWAPSGGSTPRWAIPRATLTPLSPSALSCSPWRPCHGSHCHHLFPAPNFSGNLCSLRRLSVCHLTTATRAAQRNCYLSWWVWEAVSRSDWCLNPSVGRCPPTCGGGGSRTKGRAGRNAPPPTCWGSDPGLCPFACVHRARDLLVLFSQRIQTKSLSIVLNTGKHHGEFSRIRSYWVQGRETLVLLGACGVGVLPPCAISPGVTAGIFSSACHAASQMMPPVWKVSHFPLEAEPLLVIIEM